MPSAPQVFPISIRTVSRSPFPFFSFRYVFLSFLFFLNFLFQVNVIEQKRYCYPRKERTTIFFSYFSLRDCLQLRGWDGLFLGILGCKINLSQSLRNTLNQATKIALQFCQVESKCTVDTDQDFDFDMITINQLPGRLEWNSQVRRDSRQEVGECQKRIYQSFGIVYGVIRR